MDTVRPQKLHTVAHVVIHDKILTAPYGRDEMNRRSLCFCGPCGPHRNTSPVKLVIHVEDLIEGGHHQEPAHVTPYTSGILGP